MAQGGYIYFMTNDFNNVLYVGVTNDIKRRMTEHNEGQGSIFTQKYNCRKLVYFESFPDIEQAIQREKQIKNWKREWKNKLVEKVNPDWIDLAPSVISNGVISINEMPDQVRHDEKNDAGSGPA